MSASAGPGPCGEPRGARLLALYPPAWRERYRDEMIATLEERAIDWPDRVDLVRGALDAWLHRRTRVPGVAALLAGGLWTTAAALIVSQPAPPDWPGFLLETLPLAAVAALLGGVATIGSWARRSDAIGRPGLAAVAFALIGHGAWAATLVAAWLGGADGVTTIATQVVGSLGAMLVGLLLLRAGDERVGALLTIGPALLVFGWPVAWLGAGLSWTLLGTLLLLEPEAEGPLPTRLA